MTRHDPQLKLRLPSNLKEQIEAAALASNRSINAELISRLEQSFITNEKDTLTNIQNQLDDLATNYDKLLDIITEVAAESRNIAKLVSVVKLHGKIDFVDK